MSEAIEILIRILDKCRRKSNGCLPCYMSLSNKGYSVIKIDGKNHKTHRVIMHLMGKLDLDSNLPVLHNDSICSSRACVEFNHLRIGTYGENATDVIVKQGHNNAKGRRKTYCPQGHEYNPNIIGSNKAQVCLICKRENNRRRSSR